LGIRLIFIWTSAIITLIVVLILAVQFVVLGRAVAKRKAALNHSWATVLLPLDEIPKRFPKLARNQAAMELAQLSEVLGIYRPPAPITSDDETRIKAAYPHEEDRKEFGRILPFLWEYVDKEVSGVDETIDPLPDPIQEFVLAHQQQLSALCDRVLNNELPRWAIDLDRPDDEDFTASDDLISLQRLLTAVTLDQIRKGNSSDAWRTVRAAWRIDEALSARPEDHVQHDVIRSAKLLVGTLLRMNPPLPPDLERFFQKDFKESFLLTYEVDSFNALRMPRSRGRSSVFDRFRFALFERSKFGAASAAASQLMCDAVGRMRRQSPCDDEVRGRDPRKSPEARSDPLVMVFLPTSSFHFEQLLFRFLIERELAETVLAAKSRLLDNREPCLAVLDSTVCPGARWDCRLSSDKGSVTISFAGSFESTEFKRFDLPLTHSWTARRTISR